MTDFFALLDQPRQPWLDEEVLEKVFHQRARSSHPDANSGASGSEFVQLNEAFAVLRNPKSRLQHLLALEGATSIEPAIAPDFIELFASATEIAARARKESVRGTSEESAITRSMSEIRRRKLRHELATMIEKLEAEEAKTRNELRALNEMWTSDRTAAVSEAGKLQQRFAFSTRWLSTLRELQFALTSH